MTKKTFILPLLAVAAIAAGCGSDSSTSASTYGEPTAAATGTAAPEKPAAVEAPGDATSETAQAPANGATAGDATSETAQAPADDATAGDATSETAQAPADDAPTDGAAPAPADDATPAKAISVDIADFAFAPNAIKAKVGQKITFTNQDSAPHTATATEGAKFDSGQLDQGKSFSYTAKKAGTISFICSFHPNMTGTIDVSG